CSGSSCSSCCSRFRAASSAGWWRDSAGCGAASGRPPMLEVHGLTKSFGGFLAVSEVSMAVPEGQIAAVIGPNGAGKSTLSNLITGPLQPTAGRVVVDGRDITGVAPHRICRLGMGRSFQRTNIFPKLTVFENVQAALLAHRGLGRNFWSLSQRL